MSVFLEAPLETLCRKVTDGTHDSPKLLPDGVPFIKGKHISQGRLNLDYCDYISRKDHLKVIARSKPERGDTLFSNIGSVGDSAFVNTDAEFSIKNVALFKPDFERVVPKYLFYLLRSPGVLGGLLSMRSGSAQPFIGLETLRKYMVRYHGSLSTQSQVVSILSAYDDLIENNTRRIEILEEMARRLYDEWFVQFRFQGHEKAEFKESELGLIPEGWKVSCLGYVADEVREAVHPSKVSPATPYIGLEHLPRRSITLREWGSADSVSSGKLSFRRGDVLFGKIRPYFHKVVIAPFSGICSSDTILIRPKKDNFLGVVLCCSSSDKFVDYATQTSNGTKMPRADWKVLKNYPVLIPSDGLLSDFNTLVLGVVSQARNLMLKNVNLRAQRDLLLPKLISGEIDVSDIPMPT